MTSDAIDHKGFRTLMFSEAAAWLVLTLSMLLTVLAWTITNEQVTQRAQDRFDFEAERTRTAVHHRMQDYENLLLGALGLFRGSNTVTREEWREYVAALRINSTLPGIQSLGYAQWITPQQRTGHIQSIRSVGFSQYTILPAGEREFYAPVIFPEPYAGPNMNLPGFDLYSNPELRTVLETARDHAQPGISAALPTLVSAGENGPSTMMMVVAVYRNGAPTQSVEARRATLQGFVFLQLRATEFLSGIVRNRTKPVDYTIYDGTAVNSTALLHTTRITAANMTNDAPVFQSVDTLDLPLRKWTLAFSSSPEFDQSIDTEDLWFVAAGGTTLNLLIFGFILTLARQRERATREVDTQALALHNSDERFRRMVDASPNAMIAVDQQGLIRIANVQIESLLGYTRAELIGQHVELLVPLRNRHTHARQFDEFMKVRQTRAMGVGRVLHGRHKDGHEVAIEASLTPIEIDATQMVLTTIVDISTRLRMQHAMEKLASISPSGDVFDSIAAAVGAALNVRCCGIGQLIDNNQRVCVLGLYDNGTVGGRLVYELSGTPCADTDRCETPFIVERDVADRFPNDPLLRQLGASSYRAESLHDDDGKMIGVLFAMDSAPCHEDATERALMRLAARRATLEIIRAADLEKLRLSEQRWQFALDGAGDGIWDWNTLTNKAFFSPRWKHMLGYDDIDIGDDVSEWSSRVHPDDLAPCYEDVGRHLRGEAATYQNEHRVLCKDGSYKWILDRGKVVEWTTDGEPLRMIGTHADLTQRKSSEQERERLQRQLQQAKKMEAIGQLTGGIAHDFNNMLASILGYADLLRDQLSPHASEKNLFYLSQVQKAGERARDLVAKMLAFARGKSQVARELDPRALLREAMHMLSPTLPSSMHVNIDIDEQVSNIRADPTGLHQIITNLAINARDAIEGHGEIQIGLHRAGAHEAICNSCFTSFSGSFVTLSVSDTGQGMDVDTLTRIFDPFFTTKEVGKGTGLGLSIIHGITHDVGGHILVESTPGNGTTFRVLFPTVSPVTVNSATDSARLAESLP